MADLTRRIARDRHQDAKQELADAKADRRRTNKEANSDYRKAKASALTPAAEKKAKEELQRAKAKAIGQVKLADAKVAKAGDRSDKAKEVKKSANGDLKSYKKQRREKVLDAGATFIGKPAGAALGAMGLKGSNDKGLTDLISGALDSTEDAAQGITVSDGLESMQDVGKGALKVGKAGFDLTKAAIKGGKMLVNPASLVTGLADKVISVLEGTSR